MFDSITHGNAEVFLLMYVSKYAQVPIIGSMASLSTNRLFTIDSRTNLMYI